MLKSWWNRTIARKTKHAKRKIDKRMLRFEPLEERNLLTITVTQVLPDWIAQGPSNPPASNRSFVNNGSIAYDNVSNIIMGAPILGGDIEQTSTGNLNWRNIGGGTPGVVQVDNTSIPGQSIRYSSNQFLGTFSSGPTGQSSLIARTFNAANQQVGVTRTLPLIVNGANGADIQSVEFCRFLGPGSIQAFNPWVLNSVDPTRLMIGTNFLWESLDQGNTVSCLQGLIDDNDNAVDDNLDGNINDGTEFEPDWGGNPNGDPPTNVQQIGGPVTAMAYGGRNPNGTPNPDLLWVGASSATPLLLRTSGNGTGALPNPVTAYTGGTVLDIAMNPNNWQQTYVIDGNSVYGTTNGGATFSVLNGNLPVAGLSSLVYISGGPRGDSIAVGGFGGGVYRMFINNPGVWISMDDPFPNSTLPIFTVADMDYDARDNVLVVGTFGGGAFSLPNANDDRPTNVITVDGAGGADQVNFVVAANGNLSVTDTTGSVPNALNPTLALSSISSVFVQNLGANAQVTLDFSNGNPLPNISAANFVVNGNATTRLVANAVSSYVLTDTSLQITGLSRTITLNGVGNADLTGVGNNFNVSGWTGGGSLTGIGVNNTVSSTSDANYTLSGGQGVPGGLLTSSLGTNMTLNNIASALLTGGPGANNFNVTGWNGTGIISGGGGANDSLTQAGNSSYTFNTTQMSSNTGTALSLVGIVRQNYTAGPAGALFWDTGLSGGATAFLTPAAGQTNTVKSQKDVDFTLTNTQIIGGSGTLNLLGNLADFTYIRIVGGPNPHFIDVGAYTGSVTPVLNAAADTLRATVAAATVNYTLSTAALNITATGPARNVNFKITALGGINLTGGTGTNTFNINSWNRPGSFFGTSGNSTYNIGAVGGGNLDGITGKITLNSTAGNNQLNVNDAANAQGTNYHINDTLVAIDTTTNPARTNVFGGVGIAYNAGITNVTVRGSKGADKYLVTPSVTTEFTADNSAALAVNGYLGTVFLGTTNHVRSFTNAVGVPSPGNAPTNYGFWTLTTATNPQPRKINWVNIDSNGMNGLGLLVLGGGTQPSNTSQPIVQVYDAETGQMYNQFLAYPATYQLGIKVAVGGNLGGANGPLIVTAPGRGTTGNINFYSKLSTPAGTVNAATPQGTLPAATLNNAVFQPYGANYANGINIALGSVQANGLPDLIVAPQRGALPVKVYSLALVAGKIVPTLKGSFMAYPARYIGGVNVAGGNVLGHTGALSTTTDVVTAPQTGMQSTVEVWDGTTIKNGSTTATLFRSFLAMAATFRGGVSVAVGDVNGDGKLDIVTGAGSTGGSIVSVFSGATVVNKAVPLGIIGTNPTVNGALVPPFAAYTDSSNFAPVSVALKDVDGDGRVEIVTAQGTNGKSQLLRYWKVNAGGSPPVFQYPNTSVGAPPTPTGGLSIA